MRVLIVAPEQPGLHTIPEVRAVQAWHYTSTLNGKVTLEDVVQTCLATAFDTIHFATHGGPEGLQLSDGELLTPSDVARIARMHDTPEIFFNACNTAGLAARVVREGPQYAISALNDLPDDDAWKFPYAYYSARQAGHAKGPVGAFMAADANDGSYALLVAPAYVQELQACMAQLKTVPGGALTISRRELIILLTVFLALAVTITYVLVNLTGNT